MQIGMAMRSLNDSEFSGDQCGYWDQEKHLILCMIDGLGHGRDAEHAGKSALGYVGENLSDTFQRVFSGCDSALRSTRGCAMGIARVEKASRILHFAGIGNTRSVLFGHDGKQAKTLNSDRGIIGGGFRRLVPDIVHLKHGDTLIMSTDGIAEKFDISPYGRNILFDATALANRVLEDWGRATDDRAVLVFKNDG